jgi:peroxiredoxin
MKNLLLIALLLPQLALSMTGLSVGDSAPNLSFKDTDGREVNFSSETKTTVAVFYRGAWCPYCMTQLNSIESDVMKSLGDNVQVVAISVDKIKNAKKMKSKFKYSFRVISDPQAISLTVFKIINQLSDELVKKYKSAYKIDVEADSGEKHHIVAHPAVFIIKKGKITYADIHLGYKERTKNADILKNI